MKVCNFFVSDPSAPTSCPASPSISDSTYYQGNPSDERFVAAEALTDDDCDGQIDVDHRNYWQTPNLDVGDDAYLVIDLGCIRQVEGVRIRNTQDWVGQDR